MTEPAAPTTVTNNYYYNCNDCHPQDPAANAPEAGTIENLPPGTTDKDVQDAITNGYARELIALIKEKIESDPDMDPEMKAFLLGQIEKLEAGLLDVDPEVQAAVDAEYGEHNAGLARSTMDMLMDQFEATASEERTREARNTDSDGTSSEEGEGAGNWFIQLAKALADIQSKWLERLMESYDKMQANVSDELGEDATQEQKDANTAKQKAFIQAQAEVTAYARLFGMASETTANVIKSLGDGLTSVARKQ